jgi:transcriptional regulator with XRE-family HTH domain
MIIFTKQIIVMSEIGKIISDKRQVKGLTQEELADSSKVSLRTIQRIEGGESVARAKTLSLICDVLQIDIEELLNLDSPKEKSNLGSLIINGLFVLIINIVLIVIFGYLTMDLNASPNSKVAALLLSFFIPFFIVYQTRNLLGFRRLIYYGSGLFFYAILFSFIVKFPILIISAFLPSIIIFWSILFYGDRFIREK